MDQADTERVSDLGHIPRSQGIDRESLPGFSFTLVDVMKCRRVDNHARPDALKHLPDRIERRDFDVRVIQGHNLVALGLKCGARVLAKLAVRADYRDLHRSHPCRLCFIRL